MKNIASSPMKLTVERGDSVTFEWRDGGTNHNVTSVGKLRFESASSRGSGSSRVTFRKPGLCLYRCTLHLGTRGSTRVTEFPTDAAAPVASRPCPRSRPRRGRSTPQRSAAPSSTST